jgi:hypothetical protein
MDCFSLKTIAKKMFVLTLRSFRSGKISLVLQVNSVFLNEIYFYSRKQLFSLVSKKTEPRYSGKNQVVKGCQIVFRPKKNPSLNCPLCPAMHTFAMLGCLQISSANRKPANMAICWFSNIFCDLYLRFVDFADLNLRKCFNCSYSNLLNKFW